MCKLFGLFVLVFVHFTEGSLHFCWDRDAESRTSLENVPKWELKKFGKFLRAWGDAHFDHFDFNFEHEAIDVNGTLDNVYVSGLNNFTMPNSGFEIIHLLFANVSVEGDYDVTGDIGKLFDIFGTGRFWLHLINLRIRMPANMTESCLYTELFVHVDKVENHFYNFMYDDELEEIFNNVFIDLIPEVIDVIGGELKDGLEAIIQPHIDAFIDWILDQIFGKH